MRSRYGNPNEVLREIGGQFRQGTDKIVSPPKFGAFCKILWPNKTAENLAALSGHSPRTTARWLSGEHDPPVLVAFAIAMEMFRRDPS